VSNCAGGNFLFCEDFEALGAGTATSTLWSIAKSGGTTATIEATPNAQSAPKTLGAKALHLHTGDGQGGSGFAFLVPKSFAPPGNSFFGRVWVWVDAFPIKPDFAHFTLVEVTGTGDGTLVRPLGGQFIPSENSLQALLGVGSDGGPTGDWTDWQPTVPTVNKQWQCLEWQLNASDNIVNVFIDGVAKPELSISTKKHSLRGGNAAVDFRFPAFNQIKIGWQLYQGGATPGFYDLWFDGMALSTTRIGCGG
jgi:hypothetical protein